MIINFSASIIPSQNANSLQVVKTSNALVNNGEKVFLFSRRVNSSENIKKYYNIESELNCFQTKWIGVPFIGGIIYGITNNFRLSNLITGKREIIDIYGRDIYSVLFSLLFNIRGVTYESHMIPLNYLKFFMEYLLFKSKKFNKLITTSNSLKEAYIKLYEIDEEKVIVINNGSDSHDYSIDNTTELKDSMNITYVGSLKEGKGIELVIRLAEVFTDSTFRIVGGNDNQISALQKKYQIPSNVVFEGFVKQVELQDIYKLSDIVLAPYSDDYFEFRGIKVPKYPSPLKIIEYMSYGKMIIASDLEMCREILCNYHNALLCDDKDINMWIEAIRIVKEDRKLAYELSSKAFVDFNSNLTWDIRAKKIINAIYNN
jgi:glycosyltransferase involved in cell wall biosynthesis